MTVNSFELNEQTISVIEEIGGHMPGGFFIYFDQLFPLETNVKIIAHRGGGIEGPENTVAGLNAASKLGAYGSETDIQRTKDGHYDHKLRR